MGIDLLSQEVITFDGDPVAMAIGGVEHARGSAHDDIIIGNRGPNILYGGDGDDVIMGAGGNDSLSGQNAADYLLGGPGNDTVNGDAGIDSCRSESVTNCES